MDPRISPSGINDYMICPKRFYYHYIAKAPARPIETLPIIVGKAMHEIIADFYSNYRLDTSFSAKTRLAMLLKKKLEETPVLNIYRETMENMLLNLANFDEYRLRAGYVNILAVEEEYARGLVHGIIDLLVSNRRGDKIVVDWKTGGYGDYNTQMQTYMWLTGASKAIIVYLRTGKWETIEREPGFNPEEIVREIMEMKEYPPRYGKHCDECPYFYTCYYERNAPESFFHVLVSTS